MSIEMQDIFQTQGKFLVSKLDFRNLPQFLKRKISKFKKMYMKQGLFIYSQTSLQYASVEYGTSVKYGFWQKSCTPNFFTILMHLHEIAIGTR